MDQRHAWCFTLLSAKPRAETLALCSHQITKALAELQIEPVLVDLKLHPGGSVIAARRLQFELTAEKISRLKEWLRSVTFSAEVVLHPAVSHTDFKLVVFDLDSTLITCEVIDELAAMMGVGEQVAAITASAMRGEIDFAQSFRRRISLLKGLDENRVREFTAKIEYTPGAQLLTTILKRLGYKVTIATGGFDFVASRLQRELGIDEFRSNRLDFTGGKATGEVAGAIVDADGKRAFLLETAQKYGIAPEQVIAVGDGANDIPMMQTAGFSVAFHAKPKVAEIATCCVSHLGLDALLYILNVPAS